MENLLFFTQLNQQYVIILSIPLDNRNYYDTRNPNQTI